MEGIRMSDVAGAQTQSSSQGNVKTLHASEREFRAMFELSSVGMAQIEPATGRLLRVNRKLCDMTGYSAKELGTKTIFDLTHADDVQRNRRDFGRLVGGETNEMSMEKRIRRKDGTIIWVLANKCVLRDDDGDAELVQEVITDITARVRAEQAVLEREHALKEFINALPVAIYTTDAQGRVTQFNQAAIDLAGRVPLLGRDEWCVCWKLYNPDGSPLPLEECPMAVSLRENRPVRGVEAIAERPDGSRVSLLPYPTPLRDAQGRLVGGVNMLVDITERKADEEALRRNEQFLRLVMDAMPAGVAYFDNNSRLRFGNSRLSDWFGHGGEELQGKRVCELFGGDSPLCARLDEALQGKLVKHEAEFVPPDGEHRIVDVRFVPDISDDNKVEGCVGMIQDITASKQIEWALRRANNSLEEFVYAASHDLQQPLRKIHTFADMLDESLGERLDGESRDWLGRLRNAVQRMDTLIRNTLELSRVAKIAPGQRAVVSLDSVVRGSLRELESDINESGARVVADELPDVFASPSQVQQVMVNLISNAIKYRHKDRAPVIRISAGRADRMIEVTIRDNGMGFDDRHSEQIFGMFQRLHPPEQHPGTGIGLTVCRKIIEGHDGTISARSTPGEGAVFRFTLPAANRPLVVA
jgi:PAS domain S-box-containing protein